MAFKDYLLPIIILLGTFSYFQFFKNGLNESKTRLEISSDKVLFHANWTKSLDEVCCISKLHDAFELKGITDLEVLLSMSNFNQEQVRRIFPITKFQTYKNIKLDLSGLNITNSGIEYVLNLIQQNVETLQLGLSGLHTQQGFGKYLAQKLSSFGQLKKLTVSLIMSLKGKQVEQFIQYHRPSTTLDSFHLILIGNQIKKQQLTHVEQYFAALDLKEFNLNLYANKIGAQGAQILSKALTKTKSSFESLALDLYFNNITETGTQNITSAIGQMSQTLRSLQLNFDFNYIKNEGGKSVGSMLQKLTKLESLNLGVASKNFGYLGYKYVVNGVQKLTQLKKLILRCGINRVGYNGAQITKEMLAKLTNLNHLELGFLQNYIGDDGIGLLSEQIASMKGLKNVYVNFGFNDAKSYGLIKTIKSFINNEYQSLHIGLSSNQFRDQDVKLIEPHLTTLIKNNGIFKFDFIETAISKNQMKRLEHLFNQANNKYGKTAKISVNSVIPEEEPKPVQQPKKQEKKVETPAKTQEKVETPKTQTQKQAEAKPEATQQNTANSTQL